MKRTVSRVGPATLFVSLPSKWVKQYAIKKGDEVEIENIENQLIISFEKKHYTGELTADLGGFSPYLCQRFISRNYHKGYDELRLIIDPNLLNSIQERLSELIGFELVENRNNRLVIKDISDRNSLNPDQLLRKIFLIIHEMFDDLIKFFNKQDSIILENIVNKDLDVNKYSHFCLRSLNKGWKFKKELKSNLFFIIRVLEDIGDEIKGLAKYLINVKRTKSDILPFLKKIQKLFEESYNYFYNPATEKAEAIYTLYKDNNNLLESYINNNKIDLWLLIKLRDINNFTSHILKNLL